MSHASRVPLLLALLLANLALIGLLLALSQRSDQLARLQDELDASRLRLDVTADLLEHSLQRLSALSPGETATLESRARIARDGDPRLLDPNSHPELHNIFDEML